MIFDTIMCFFTAKNNIGVVIALWAPIVLVSSFPLGGGSVPLCFSKLILSLMSND